MAYPVVPVKLCAHLKGAVPGKLSPDKLRKTVGGTLHHCAADGTHSPQCAQAAPSDESGGV